MTTSMTSSLSDPLASSARPTSHLRASDSLHDTSRSHQPQRDRDRDLALDATEIRERRLEVHRGLGQHLAALHRHAARRARTREEALDLVQETALRALAFAWSFERGTNLRAWLHQVQDSVFLTQCRKRTRERRAFDAFHLDPCAWPKHEQEPAMRRMTQPVLRALDALPRNFRDVVRVVDIEGLSYRDAADALGVPLGTVMSRLHRGRRLLANTLADSHSARRDHSLATTAPAPASTPASADTAPTTAPTTASADVDASSLPTRDSTATATSKSRNHASAASTLATKSDQTLDATSARRGREVVARQRAETKRAA